MKRLNSRLEKSADENLLSFGLWLKKNKYKVAILCSFAVLLKFSSNLPYINLIFRDSFFVYSPFIFLTIIVLKVQAKVTICLSILLFLICFLFAVIRQNGFYEAITNYIFVILSATVVKEMIEFRSE